MANMFGDRSVVIQQSARPKERPVGLTSMFGDRSVIVASKRPQARPEQDQTVVSQERQAVEQILQQVGQTQAAQQQQEQVQPVTPEADQVTVPTAEAAPPSSVSIPSIDLGPTRPVGKMENAPEYVQAVESLQESFNDPEFRKSSSIAIIKQFEGFDGNAYWDVNAYRTGYGSDTVTREDGTVERVTKETKVTREDADRDLARRVQEFENIAVNQVGAEVWADLPSAARSALTSIAYNYGDLPNRIVPSVKSGDINAIADAVEGLSGDNKGINSRRRMMEASIIRNALVLEGQ